MTRVLIGLDLPCLNLLMHSVIALTLLNQQSLRARVTRQSVSSDDRI